MRKKYKQALWIFISALAGYCGLVPALKWYSAPEPHTSLYLYQTRDPQYVLGYSLYANWTGHHYSQNYLIRLNPLPNGQVVPGKVLNGALNPNQQRLISDTDFYKSHPIFMTSSPGKIGFNELLTQLRRENITPIASR